MTIIVTSDEFWSYHVKFSDVCIYQNNELAIK